MNVDNPRARIDHHWAWLIATDQVLSACETILDDSIIVLVGDENRAALPWFKIGHKDGTRIGILGTSDQQGTHWLAWHDDGLLRFGAKTCTEAITQLMDYHLTNHTHP